MRPSETGIVAVATRDALIRIAKELFYHDRTFERLLERAAERSMPSAELAALRAWLPQGRVDWKRGTPSPCSRRCGRCWPAPEPMQVDYALEWTEVWDEATTAAAASRQSGASGTAAWLTDDRVLEELRLEPDTYIAVRDRALLRLLAAHEAARRRHSLDAGVRGERLNRLRARHGLFSRAALDRLARGERDRRPAAGADDRGGGAARGYGRARRARAVESAAG